MNKKNKKLINNTIIFMIGNLGSKIIQFLLVPLYTYTLSTEEYGIFELVLTTINLLLPVFSIQIADAFLRYGLDKKYSKESVFSIVLKILFGGSICSIICIPIFKLNATLNNWLHFFILLLNLRMYRDIFAINLKIHDKNKLYAIDSILYTFILCITNVILLLFGNMGITGYFISYIIANFLSIVFLVLCSKTSIKILFNRVDKKLLKEIIRYSIPMIINSISWWITNASDRYMIQFFMNDSDVGVYSVASKIPTILTTFIGIFNQAWTISAIDEFSEDDNHKSFYSDILKKFCSISFIGATILIFIIKPFMKIYVNNSFFAAWSYSVWLIIGAVSSGICSFLASIYYAYKKTVDVTITTLIGGIINVLLNLWLIKRIGVLGASIATYCSWTIIATIRLFDIKKIVKVEIEYFKILYINFLLIIEGVIITVSSNWLIYIISSIPCIIILLLERNFLVELFEKVMNKFRRYNEKNKGLS